MTTQEMINILRGKVLLESQEEIQIRLNEIADALERTVKERDAAVEDLRKHRSCRDCLFSGEDCVRCISFGASAWEWRGVKDETV